MSFIDEITRRVCVISSHATLVGTEIPQHFG